ncbi:MAG: hypothetical protein KTR32_29330, partial [Granulosicoccus sp.]|nr:hypothetical protein [Granulosicoccus sp.]
MAQPYLHPEPVHTSALSSLRVTYRWALVFLLLFCLASTAASAESASKAHSHVSITKVAASSVSLDRSFLHLSESSASQDQICIQPQSQQQPYSLQLGFQHASSNPGPEQIVTLHGNRGNTTGVQLDLISNTVETAITCSDTNAVLLRVTSAGG